jgi:2,4-dienoyl-CoA reductase-like NADH-dependent reductase (Old Yellow Enzyme family)
MSHLFQPYILRGLTFRNRIGVSPMCQYSAQDGFANDWHLVHLGSRAAGGAGLVIAEATAVEARGRISPQDIGIWSDAHVEPLARIARFITEQGAVAGIQLAHAGRKAGTFRPWAGQSGYVPHSQGGWQAVGASPIPFSETSPAPMPLSVDEIQQVKAAFVRGAERAVQAGFTFIELHAAHGYLLNTFMSPLSNQRDDDYGGSFENRIRLTLETAAAMRQVLPDEAVLAVRISATDWVDGGWTVDDSVQLARALKPLGVDLMDVSSGGLDPRQQITLEAGYQVPFAERIRKEADIPTAAVGLINEPVHADEIIRNGQADMALLARALLRDPHWPIHAARELGEPAPIPPQYLRGF